MANEAIELINQLEIEFKIVPKSPLLVVEGSEKDANTSSEVNWLLGSDEKPYIPGSTLKGLFREKITEIYYDYLNKDSQKLEKCIEYTNIFDGYQDEMEKLVNAGDIAREDVYKESLEVEQLFGSKVLKGRFWTSDAKIIGDYDKENKKYRNITPIDRFTGGAVVPLKFEYVDNNFSFKMIIKNVTKEELKTLLFIIRDSQNGEIRIGNSKTRGFGEIEFEIEEFTFKQYNNSLEDIKIKDFSNIVDNLSYKIADKYLITGYKLREEFLDIHDKNEFVKEMMRGDN